MTGKKPKSKFWKTIQVRWPIFWFGLVLINSPFSAEANSNKYEKVCEENDAEKCVQPIMVGEVAPFSGQLVSPKKALADALAIDRCFAKKELFLEKERALLQLDVDAVKRKCEINAENYESKIGWFNLQLEQEKQQVWYEHPAFVIVSTIVVMSGLYVGAVKTVQAL